MSRWWLRKCPRTNLTFNETLSQHWNRVVSLLIPAVYRHAFRRTKTGDGCEQNKSRRRLVSAAKSQSKLWKQRKIEKLLRIYSGTDSRLGILLLRIRLLSVHNSDVSLHPSWDYLSVLVLLPVLTWLSEMENRLSVSSLAIRLAVFYWVQVAVFSPPINMCNLVPSVSHLTAPWSAQLTITTTTTLYSINWSLLGS